MLTNSQQLFLRKKRDHNQKRLEVEREKNRLANLTIEEGKSLRAQYKVQANNKREARKADESDMGEYQNKANALRDQVSTIQSKLEFHEEKVKKMKKQFEEWPKYIDSFDVQLNIKIVELDIKKKEL